MNDIRQVVLLELKSDNVYTYRLYNNVGVGCANTFIDDTCRTRHIADHSMIV